MELLPLGPVVLIDTPGLDDEGKLGTLRIKKAYQMLNKTDIAVLVVDGSIGMTEEDDRILTRIKEKNIPYVIVFNKMDLITDASMNTRQESHSLQVSAKNGYHIQVLKELIASQLPKELTKKKIVGDLIAPLDFVVLVVLIDSAAPKGRLILPQQQTIRDILDAGAVSIVVKDTELKDTLDKLAVKPKLVITDSQAFGKVSKEVPRDIPLTSFSILFARYKGNLDTLITGARTLDTLEDGDTVLISEGSTHHRQSTISTETSAGFLAHTKKELHFSFTSGTEFPNDLSDYQLIVHCGGCMLNEREVKYRTKCALDQNVPITNYGIAIAHMKGILTRSLEPFL